MEAGDIDMAVVRENTEGEYADVGGFQYHGMDDEVAIQTGVFTRRGIERVVRYAFELAQRRDRKKVTSVTKSNAQRYSMTLWDRVFRDVAAGYPDIETQSLLVDAAAMDFVRRPETFDVVVASNLFADILTDLAAAITGSIGLAASANIDPTRRNPSVFEPIHGSAPDIAGKGVANPLATLLSAAMMLDHLGESAAASTLNGAVKAVLSQGEILHAGPWRKGNDGGSRGCGGGGGGGVGIVCTSPRAQHGRIGKTAVGTLPSLPSGVGAGLEGFLGPQPRSLIVCDSLIVCAPAFSSPIGVEPSFTRR